MLHRPARMRASLFRSLTLMRTLEQHITQYAAYHRDRRNIATHFIGVPMIVFAVVLALIVPQISIGDVRVAIALIATLIAIAYYLVLDLKMGGAMLIYLAGNYWLACETDTALSASATLSTAAAIFVAGWIIQFVGHKYEGMKPAFFDDFMGLAIGPLFVMAEVFFMLGWKPALQQYVEARVGPTLAARDGAPIGPSQD